MTRRYFVFNDIYKEQTDSGVIRLQEIIVMLALHNLTNDGIESEDNEEIKEILSGGVI